MMVGMPYPNIKSPELQEKMAYLDKNMVSAEANSEFCERSWVLIIDFLFLVLFLPLSLMWMAEALEKL